MPARCLYVLLGKIVWFKKKTRKCVAYIKVCYILRSKPLRVFQSRLHEDGFPKESGTVSKNTRKRITYIKVCYVYSE